MYQRWAQWMVLALSIGFTSGCVYERVVHDGWDGLRSLSDAKQDVDAADPDASPAASVRGGVGQWAILLQSVTGSDRHEKAQQLLDRIEEQAELPNLWMQDTGQVVHLCRGQYATQDDPLALNALRQTRLATVSGQRPFESAQIVAIGGASRRVPTDPLDLRRFAGMYSLQIGFYDREFGSDYRDAAHQAVQALRQEGEQAYFYHGPHRSMVTIGLFTDADFVRRGAVSAYGPRIEALQEKYPYNLGNGLTLIEKVNGRPQGTQPSLLVRIPNNP